MALFREVFVVSRGSGHETVGGVLENNERGVVVASVVECLPESWTADRRRNVVVVIREKPKNRDVIFRTESTESYAAFRRIQFWPRGLSSISGKLSGQESRLRNGFIAASYSSVDEPRAIMFMAMRAASIPSLISDSGKPFSRAPHSTSCRIVSAMLVPLPARTIMKATSPDWAAISGAVHPP